MEWLLTAFRLIPPFALILGLSWLPAALENRDELADILLRGVEAQARLEQISRVRSRHGAMSDVADLSWTLRGGGRRYASPWITPELAARIRSGPEVPYAALAIKYLRDDPARMVVLDDADYWTSRHADDVRYAQALVVVSALCCLVNLIWLGIWLWRRHRQQEGKGLSRA